MLHNIIVILEGAELLSRKQWEGEGGRGVFHRHTKTRLLQDVERGETASSRWNSPTKRTSSPRWWFSKGRASLIYLYIILWTRICIVRPRNQRWSEKRNNILTRKRRCGSPRARSARENTAHRCVITATATVCDGWEMSVGLARANRWKGKRYIIYIYTKKSTHTYV